ncbi:hypothetical protein Nepgr_004378 [Nepenthes gracilis]|uniref:Carbohydrate kinase PfkB domain-containing protein n=1 Tax=Nepenthes gracilis TaxID=150966 RepID=A0AAD3S1A0_NEPGR|nr:hypothetical protein Nepgr_004378 [Nepenthes gracilis]
MQRLAVSPNASPKSLPSLSSLSGGLSVISATYSPSLSAKMASSSPLPLPENRIVLGCGALSLDFLAAVATYPKPDDKIRTTNLKVQGGGNTGNALTCAARLGLNPRLISKVADDAQGRDILEELEADGVDTSFIVVSKEGNSPFTYIIVDNETKTRTCIHTPGYPPMVPNELSKTRLWSSLDGASLVYFDGRLHETALIVAQEAAHKSIPILVDAERKREGLDDLLKFATYVVCSARFPQVWTEASSVPRALVSMLLKLPKIKFVIVTLGEDGCVMLERTLNKAPDSAEADVDELLESLKQKVVYESSDPTCISSSVMNLRANGFGTVYGRLFVGTAEKIPSSELVDTTGAGDAFIGAILYALCAGMPTERMLPFASQVAAAGCRALGARTGLPLRTDPRLAYFSLAGSHPTATSTNLKGCSKKSFLSTYLNPKFKINCCEFGVSTVCVISLCSSVVKFHCTLGFCRCPVRTAGRQTTHAKSGAVDQRQRLRQHRLRVMGRKGYYGLSIQKTAIAEKSKLVLLLPHIQRETIPFLILELHFRFCYCSFLPNKAYYRQKYLQFRLRDTPDLRPLPPPYAS